MVIVKCDRPGCETTSTSVARSQTITLPAGWLCLMEGGASTLACSDSCFDVIWEQRAWRGGRRRRPLQELPMSEADLAPK